MTDISSLLDNAEIDVNSTVNFNFNWGTIGIIVGSVVAVVVIIIIIVYVCGRGGVNCCDTGKVFDTWSFSALLDLSEEI